MEGKNSNIEDIQEIEYFEGNLDFTVALCFNVTFIVIW